MEYRILGPLEVVDEGEPISLGRLKERLVLAILLLHANEFVSRERLIDELWGDAPPPTARKAVNVYVSQLRKALVRDGRDPIATADGGYRFEVDPDRLDAARLQQLLATARERASAGELEAAVELLREALDLWRGPTLAGLLLESHGREEVAQLDELRLTALMDRVDCDLALGRHAQVLGELHVLVGEHPLRERLRAQLMLALYRADRQAEALEAYQQARQVLVEELGIEPSPALQRLQQGILRHDPSLETASGTADANGLAPTRPFREQGTALDEQTARRPSIRVRRRYLAAAAALVLLAAVGGLTALATRASGAPRVIPNSLVRLDPQSGKVVSVVPVGVEPWPIAITPTAIWTANHGDHTVSRYDLRTHTVDSRGITPEQPDQVAVDLQGNAWITSSANPKAFVTRLEAGIGGTSPGTLYPSHIHTIRLPLAMVGYEVLGAGSLWAIAGPHGPLPGDDQVVRVDLSTDRVASVIHLHGPATAIAFGHGTAWIGTYGLGSAGDGLGSVGAESWLEAIRAGDSKPVKIVLEKTDADWGPVWIAVGGGAVWVLTYESHELVKIDPQTLRILHRLDLSAPDKQPGAVAVGAGVVWTANWFSVSKIDPRTDRIIRTIPLGDKTKVPCGIAATASAVWVAMGNSHCDTVGS